MMTGPFTRNTLAKGPPPTGLAMPPSTYAAQVAAAGGAVIDLTGKIGKNETLSLANVQAKLLRSAGCSSPHRVHFLINSSGGDFDEAFKIYNYIRNLPAQISAEAGLRCHSGALMVYLAAAHRLAHLNSEFLIHAVRIPVSSFKAAVVLTAHYLRGRAEDLQRRDDANLDLLCERTGYQRKWFAEQFQNENPLEIFEAVACGIAHEIVDVTLPCDPRWPGQVPLIPKHVYWPREHLTANFIAACRTALPRKDSLP